MFQRTEGLDFIAGAVHHVTDPVNVMAALRQQHETGFFFVSPVAADKGVGLVPVRHTFQMLHGNDFPDRAGIQHFLQRAGISGITQHVADRKDHARFLHSRHDPAAGIRCRSHGFFKKHVVAQFRKSDRRFFVHGILRADTDGIRKFRQFRHFTPAAETAFFRNVEHVTDPVPLEIAGFRNGCHGGSVTEGFDQIGVAGTATAGTDDDEGNWIRHFL